MDNQQKNLLDRQKEIAKEQGGFCLSTAYVNAKTKLRYRCVKGHEWEAVPDSIRRGTWCPQCRGTNRLSLTDMQRVAQAHGGACLSRAYKNARSKLRWRCAKGHEWEALPLNVVHHGKWCSACNRPDRLSIKRLNAYARSRGGRCLSDRYLGYLEQYQWQCSEGLTWWADWANPFSHKRWCPTCHVISRKRTYSIERLRKADMHARALGGRCLSKNYVHSKAKLRWRCIEGHTWLASYTNVMDHGRWCAQCYNNYRRGGTDHLTMVREEPPH